MQIATGWTTNCTRNGLEMAYAGLLEELDAAPDLLLLHCSTSWEPNTVSEWLQSLPGTFAVHGGTTLRGVMTQHGVHCQAGNGVGLLGLSDKDGYYGTSLSALGDDPRQAARQALLSALDQAGRPGEMPQLILMTAVPGCEEQLIAGIESVVGTEVPIIGGSSASDERPARQFANAEVATESVVLTVLFPSTDLLMAFHSGYQSAGMSGTVTRAVGHRLYEIDHRPAAEVYNQWSGGLIANALGCCSNVISQTTMMPLGRVAGHIASIPYFQLSHLGSTFDDGSIALFSEVREQESIVLMTGTMDSLVARAGRVVSSALDIHSASAEDVSGALVIFCAGCMLAIQERLDEVVAGIRTALPDKPFLGIFTLGEQGCFVGGENRHGNLMISVLLFTKGSSISLT